MLMPPSSAPILSSSAGSESDDGDKADAHDRKALLIASLGLGGLHNLPVTAWWAAESWAPGAAFVSQMVTNMQPLLSLLMLLPPPPLPPPLIVMRPVLNWVDTGANHQWHA